MQTNNLRITRIRPLISPAILAEEIPVSDSAARLVADARETVAAILAGRDPRMLAVVGPCSIHDPAAAIEYAQHLRELADELAERVYLVMRVYFENIITYIILEI